MRYTHNFNFGVNVIIAPIINIKIHNTKNLNSPIFGKSKEVKSNLNIGPFIGRNIIMSNIPSLCLNIISNPTCPLHLNKCNRIGFERVYVRA
jgi:hypothetical protein